MISQTILSFCTWVINIVLGLILIYRDISTDRFIGFLVLFLGIVKFNESLLFGNINEEFVAWLTLISFVLTAFVLLYNSNITSMHRILIRIPHRSTYLSQFLQLGVMKLL